MNDDEEDSGEDLQYIVIYNNLRRGVYNFIFHR
jgi:hypothetical protein